MDTPRKFWLVLIGVVLALVVIACSCGTILPTPTAAPTPTLPPPPTAISEQTMAGRWLDPDTVVTGTTYTTIIAQDGGYAVESVINEKRGGNELTETNWSNGVLTWTYCIPNGNCITSVTTSLDGDSLYTTWTDDRGFSGETTFQRMP